VVFYHPRTGRTWALEVKTGPRARLSRAQRGGYIAVASGRARITSRGRRALSRSDNADAMDAILGGPAIMVPEGARVSLDIVSVVRY
jgi:hypothetical protein